MSPTMRTPTMAPQLVVLHVTRGHATMRPETLLATMHSTGPYRCPPARRAMGCLYPAAVVIHTLWRFPQAMKDTTTWTFS